MEEMPRKKIVIWPAYVDKEKTRSEGRRVPKGLAVVSPTVDEIKEAAEELDLETEVQEDKSYPRNWWESKGRVLVYRDDESKESLIKKISELVKKNR
ncbi:MAG: Signal recognition particle 19 kDa protein SEC65 [Candidatus Methanohalarchaeum thermophilum]|uniref:Signal recognition particle 19 kDa protein n=1 Tax=Methanohalarchaeum thermophilum TaxID=1903181 RepID=A0A1Q6DXC2_METT1|nr:MAG: Signal recognition particle 19 kDa protein SEC65 [Candidatus Methanohalarchaeum thermophilum]